MARDGAGWLWLGGRRRQSPLSDQARELARLVQRFRLDEVPSSSVSV